MDTEKTQPTESDELAVLRWYYGAAEECTCQRCRQARRKAAEDSRRTKS